MSKHYNNEETTPEEINLEDAVAPETMAEEAEAEADECVDEELHRIEALQQQLADAKAAVEKEKKEYLFLMADFDNFRKRVVKEKAEILRNGAEKCLPDCCPSWTTSNAASRPQPALKTPKACAKAWS